MLVFIKFIKDFISTKNDSTVKTNKFNVKININKNTTNIPKSYMFTSRFEDLNKDSQTNKPIVTQNTASNQNNAQTTTQDNTSNANTQTRSQIDSNIESNIGNNPHTIRERLTNFYKDLQSIFISDKGNDPISFISDNSESSEERTAAPTDESQKLSEPEIIGVAFIDIPKTYHEVNIDTPLVTVQQIHHIVFNTAFKESCSDKKEFLKKRFPSRDIKLDLEKTYEQFLEYVLTGFDSNKEVQKVINTYLARAIQYHRLKGLFDEKSLEGALLGYNVGEDDPLNEFRVSTTSKPSEEHIAAPTDESQKLSEPEIIEATPIDESQKLSEPKIVGTAFIDVPTTYQKFSADPSKPITIKQLHHMVFNTAFNESCSDKDEFLKKKFPSSDVKLDREKTYKQFRESILTGFDSNKKAQKVINTYLARTIKHHRLKSLLDEKSLEGALIGYDLGEDDPLNESQKLSEPKNIGVISTDKSQKLSEPEIVGAAFIDIPNTFEAVNINTCKLITITQIQHLAVNHQFEIYYNLIGQNIMYPTADILDEEGYLDVDKVYEQFYKFLLNGFNSYLQTQIDFNNDIAHLIQVYRNEGLLDEKSLEGALVGYNLGENDPLNKFRVSATSKPSDERTAALTDESQKLSEPEIVGVAFIDIPNTYQKAIINTPLITVKQAHHVIANIHFEKYYLAAKEEFEESIFGKITIEDTYNEFREQLLTGFSSDQILQREINDELAAELKYYRNEGLLDEKSLEGVSLGYNLGENDPLNEFRVSDNSESSEERIAAPTDESQKLSEREIIGAAFTGIPNTDTDTDQTDIIDTTGPKLITAKQIHELIISKQFEKYYFEQEKFLENLSKTTRSSVGELDIEEVYKDFCEFLPIFYGTAEAQKCYNDELAAELKHYRNEGLLDEKSLEGVSLGYNLGENDPLNEFRVSTTSKPSEERIAALTTKFSQKNPPRESKLEKSSDEIFLLEDQLHQELLKGYVFSSDKSQRLIINTPEQNKFNLNEGGDNLLDNRNYYDNSFINIDEIISSDNENKIIFNPGFVPKLRTKKSELAFDLFKIYIEKYNIRRIHEYINSLSDYEVGEYVFNKGILHLSTTPHFIFNDDDFLRNKLNQYYNMDPDELPIFIQLSFIEYDHRFGGFKGSKKSKQSSDPYKAPSDIFTSLPGGEEYPDFMSMSQEDFLKFSAHMDDLFQEEEEEEEEYEGPKVTPSFNFISSDELKRSNIVYTRNLEPELVEALGDCFKDVLITQLQSYEPKFFKDLIYDFKRKYGYDIRARLKENFPTYIDLTELDRLSAYSFSYTDDTSLEEIMESNYSLLSIISLNKRQLSEFVMPTTFRDPSYFDIIINSSHNYRLEIAYESFFLRQITEAEMNTEMDTETGIDTITDTSAPSSPELIFEENQKEELQEWSDDRPINTNEDLDPTLAEIFSKIDKLLYQTIHWEPSRFFKNIKKIYKKYSTLEFNEKVDEFIQDSLMYLVNPKNSVLTDVAKFSYDKFISYFGYDAQVRLNTRINNYFEHVVFKRSTYSPYFEKRTYIRFLADFLNGKITFSSIINSFQKKLAPFTDLFTSPIGRLRRFMGVFTHSEYIEQVKQKHYNDFWNKALTDAKSGFFDLLLYQSVFHKNEEDRSENEKELYRLSVLAHERLKIINQELIDSSYNFNETPYIFQGTDHESERILKFKDNEYHYFLEEGEIEVFVNVPIYDEDGTFIGQKEELIKYKPEDVEILIGDANLSIIKEDLYHELISASKKDLISIYEIPEALEVLMSHILYRREYELFHQDPLNYTSPLNFFNTSSPKTLAELNTELEKLPFERTIQYGLGEHYYRNEDDYKSDKDSDSDSDKDYNENYELSEFQSEILPEQYSDPEPILDSDPYPASPYYFIGENYDSITTRDILGDSMNIHNRFLEYLSHTESNFDFFNIVNLFEIDEESLYSFTNESALGTISDSAFRHAVFNSKLSFNEKLSRFEDKNIYQLKNLYNNNSDISKLELNHDVLNYRISIPSQQINSYLDSCEIKNSFTPCPTAPKSLIEAVTTIASLTKEKISSAEKDIFIAQIDAFLRNFDFESEFKKAQFKSKIYKDLIESESEIIFQTQINKFLKLFKLSQQLQKDLDFKVTYETDSNEDYFLDSDSDDNNSDSDSDNNDSDSDSDNNDPDNGNDFNYTPFNEQLSSIIEEEEDLEWGYNYLNRIKFVCKDDHKDRNIVEELLPLLDSSLHQPMPPIWTSKVTTSPENIGEFLEKVKESYSKSEETLNSLIKLVLKYKLPPEVFGKILTEYILLKNQQWHIYEREQERISQTDFTELLTIYDNFYDLKFRLENVKGLFNYFINHELDLILDEFYDLIEYRFTVMPLNKENLTGLKQLHNIYQSTKAQLDGYLSRIRKNAFIETFKLEKLLIETKKIKTSKFFSESSKEELIEAEASALFHSTYFSDANYIFGKRPTFGLITPQLNYEIQNSLSRLGVWDKNITPGFFKDAARDFSKQFIDRFYKGDYNYYPLSSHEANKIFWYVKFGEELPYDDINLFQFINFIFFNSDIFFVNFSRKNPEISYSDRQFSYTKSTISQSLVSVVDDYIGHLSARAGGKVFIKPRIDYHSELGENFKTAIRSAIKNLERPLPGFHFIFDNKNLRMGIREELKFFLETYISFEAYKLYLDSSIKEFTTFKFFLDLNAKDLSFKHFMEDAKYQNIVKSYKELNEKKDMFTGNFKLKVVKATDTFSDKMLINFFEFLLDDYIEKPILTTFPSYQNPVRDSSHIDPNWTILDCLFNYKELNHNYKIKNPIKSQIASTINLEVPYYPIEMKNKLYEYKRSPRSQHIEWVTAFARIQSSPFFTFSHPATLPYIPVYKRPQFAGRFIIPELRKTGSKIKVSPLFDIRNTLIENLVDHFRNKSDVTTITYLMHLNKSMDAMFSKFSNETDATVFTMSKMFMGHFEQLADTKLLPKIHAHNRRLYEKFLVLFNYNCSRIENAKNYDEIKKPLSSIGELLLDMDFCHILPLLPHEQHDIRYKIQFCINKFYNLVNNPVEKDLNFVCFLLRDEKFRALYTSTIEERIKSHSSFKKFYQTYLQIGELSSILENLNEMKVFKEEMSKFAKDLGMLKFFSEYMIDDLFNEFPQRLLDQIRLEFIKEVEYDKPFSLPPNSKLINVIDSSVENEKKTTEITTINESNNFFEFKDIRDEYIILKLFIDSLIKLKLGLETVQNKINSFFTFVSLNEAHNFSEFIYIIYAFYYLSPKLFITNYINYLESINFKEKFQEICVHLTPNSISTIFEQNPLLLTVYYLLRIKYDQISYNFDIYKDFLDKEFLPLALRYFYGELNVKYNEISYGLKNFDIHKDFLDKELLPLALRYFYGELNVKYNEISYDLKNFDIHKDFLDKEFLPLALRYFYIVLKNELQDDIVSSTIRAIKTVEQPLLADVISTYIPSRNWVVRNFMVRRTNSEIEFIFPIGRIIQNNFFDPIDRFIESRMDYIGNYLVDSIENNSTCIRLADRYLTYDNMYNFYNSCNNYYTYMLGIYQETRNYYNFFALFFKAVCKRKYIATLERFQDCKNFYNFFHRALIRPIINDINEFYSYQYFDNLKPAYLGILEKLTPFLVATTVDLQLYIFFYNVFIRETTKLLTGDFSSFFTISKLFKEVPQEFLRDLILGFKSTQVQRSSTFEPSTNLLYRPIGWSKDEEEVIEVLPSSQIEVTTDVFHDVSDRLEIVSDEPETTFNIPNPNSDAIKFSRSTATEFSIPYKSIESFKALSFQDKRTIEGFLFRSRRLDKFTYFNFNALDIEKLMPKVFEDSRTEEEKKLEPYRPLTVTSDKLIRDAILKSIRLSKLYFKNLICSTPEKLFTMEFVDLAHYVSELAIDCLLRDKVDKKIFPNLNNQKTNINEIDALIYKILKYQNLEPQVKPEILKFLYQKYSYNFFGELAKITIKLSTDDFFKSYLFRVEDRFPFIGSPLNYFTADIKLRIDQGLTYAFRLIGVKDNFAQISVFNGKSFISLIHDMTKSDHHNFVTKFFVKPEIGSFVWDKKPLPKFRCEFNEYDNDNTLFSSDSSNLKGQFLVSMDEKVFVLEEYLNKSPYQGQIRMIFGDTNPVQKFTQLSSYQQFLNPALRSLLQFDFGFTKIDYNDFLQGNFLTQKSILNVNYKVNIDKSFSTTPKFQLIFDNPAYATPLRSFAFPDFLEKTDYYLKSIGEYINNSTHRLVSHNAKMKELFSNKNILKLSQLYAKRNFDYNQAISKSQWNTNKYIEKFFQLSASWVKAYRDHEFNTKLNKNVYTQLRSYNVIDHVYSAPTSKRLEPIKFRSQYRYMMNSKNSWPSLYGSYYYPKFLQKNLESRFFKVFEYTENTRNSSLKNLDYYFFKRDFEYLRFTFDFFEDYCIHFTDNIPVKFLHKSLYSNYKPLNTNIAAKELGLFYRNFKQCVSNIIKNPTEAAGFVMYPLTPNYSVPVFKLSSKIKNSWTNISQKSLPFYKDFNGFLQGFDISSYVINLISTFDIIVNDKDRRFWEGLSKVTPIMFYRLFRKQAGIPLIHPDMQAPYFSFTSIVKNPSTFKFDTILIPNQIRKPYYHRRYTNIFSQYLWSKANKYDLKPMIITNPHEQIEFSRGNFLNLPNSFKQINLLQTKHQTNAYFSLYKVINFQNTLDRLDEFVNSIFFSIKNTINSMYNLNNPKFQLQNISKIFFSESKYWNSSIILWHIQNNKLFCNMFASNYRVRFRLRITYTTAEIPITNSSPIKLWMTHAGTQSRFDYDIYERIFHEYNFGSIKRLNEFHSSQEHEKNDSFKWFYYFKDMKRLNKLDLIKSEGYIFDIPSYEYIKDCIRYQNKELLEYYDSKNPQHYTTTKEKIKEKYRPDAFISTLPNKTILKSFDREGLDFKLFLMFNSSIPPVLRENKHITSLVSNYIKNLDQTQPLAIPNIEQKKSKLININKKEFNIKKSVLLDHYDLITDLLENENFSWILYHEYREELIKIQTTSFPVGLMINFCSSIIQGSILTFVLLAADFRRAPNKLTASFLLSLKTLFVFSFFSLLAYTIIDFTGFDVLTELLKKTEFSSGLQKLPQNVIKPFQLNATLDDYDATAFRTPFNSNKQSTWHFKLRPALDCYTYLPDTATDEEYFLDYIKTKAPAYKGKKK